MISTDAETISTDAGIISADAETISADVGMISADAETISADAGMISADAETVSPDAKTVPPDAGTAAFPVSGPDSAAPAAAAAPAQAHRALRRTPEARGGGGPMRRGAAPAGEPLANRNMNI